MVASILQLENRGLQDVYLTETPSINMFKYKYYQYVNFATELVRLNTDEILDFGKSSSCTIPRRGHLLSNLFLRVKVPKLVRTTGTYLSWSETLGYAIFKEGVDLEIAGVVIDTFYPGYYDIYDSFNKPDNDLGANLGILRSDTYVSSKFNATKDNDLIIPLKFWFSKGYNMSLPIVAMPNQEIKVKFKFRDFQECINYDGSPPIDYNVTECEVFAEYIYVDNAAIPIFKDASHTFLIEQVRYNGNELIPAGTETYNCRLVFNNPCKELMFACVQKSNVDNNNYFNYSNVSDNSTLVSELSLVLDGKNRFDFTPEVFNRLAYASVLHKSVPLKYVYSIPFCTRPSENQPSGTLNMSKFDNVSLVLKMQKANPECYIRVYALMYNVLTIERNLLSLKFIT
jgi:hypothetical protein